MSRIQLLPGTLEMLVLQTLVLGRRHGHGIVIAAVNCTILVLHFTVFRSVRD